MDLYIWQWVVRLLNKIKLGHGQKSLKNPALVDRLHFIWKKKKKSISVTKKKKSKKHLYYGWEQVIYTGKSFSVTEKQDEVEPHRHWGLGLSVGGPFTDTMMNIYHLSIEFF